MKDKEYYMEAALVSMKVDLDMLNDPKQYPMIYGSRDDEAYYSLCKKFVKEAHLIVNNALRKKDKPNELKRYRYEYRSGEKVPSDVPEYYMGFEIDIAADKVWEQVRDDVYKLGKLSHEINQDEYMVKGSFFIHFGKQLEEVGIIGEEYKNMMSKYEQLIKDRVEELQNNYERENPNA